MYTIKQASMRTGVSVPLLRAWERRYGIPAPERTASGYRLYDEAALVQLRAMRQLVAGGWAPRQAAIEVLAGRVPDPEPFQPTAGLGAVREFAAARKRSVGRIVAAAVALDEAEIEATLGEATLALDFEAAVENVWLPALVAVGDAWAAGNLDVAPEHALSAAILRRLGAAYDAAARPTARPSILVGLPPGSRHELGALAFAVAGRRVGIGVLYLGPDVPASSWGRAVAESGAMAVVLGVTTESDHDTAREVIAALAAGRRPPRVFVGGRGAASVDLAPAVPLPTPLGAAVDAVRQALGPAS